MPFNIFEKFKPIKKMVNKDEITPNSEELANKQETTPRSLKSFGDKAIGLVFKNFSVDGLENIKETKENNPEQKFIIAASHLHNLDLPAALSALGDDFNIQITGESVLLEQMKYLDKRLLINHVWGRENFTALDYKDDKSGKRGSFNPDNFVELEEKMENGKTPWIASHPFSTTGRMRESSIGPVYLSAKTNAFIIPTALDSIGGGSANMEGPIENIKSFLNRSEAVYHIGKPLEFPDLDVSIIEKVLTKRKNAEAISAEEMEQFKNIHKQLKERASVLSEHIAGLLPAEKRKEN